MGNKKILIEALKNLNKAKAPAKKADIDYVSKMGYRDDSPFNKRKSITINTQDGSIDMSKTGKPLVANGKYLPPYSGMHQFDTNQVTEVPLDQAKKGGSKLYSSNLKATNRLYAKNPLFKKPKKNPLFKKKNYKKKIYDPSSMYFQDGGPVTPEEWEKEIRKVESQIGNPNDWTMEDYYLLQDKLDQYRNWRETTPEGQAVVDSHNEEGEYDIPLPAHLQDYTSGMMKAKLAYANEFGNPAAQRMIVMPDNPYDFGDGMTGTHYMSSMDNYAVPQIQDENGQLTLGDYDASSKEAIRFDNGNDARYFAEHYKEVSPGFIEAELTPEEIDQYVKGGYIVEEVTDPSIATLNRFVGGGPVEDCGEGFTYDPKLGCIPTSEDSLTEDQKWMTNWYTNRKIEVPETEPGLKKAVETALPAYNPESPMIQQMQAFPLYKEMPQEYMESPGPGGFAAAGIYDTSGKHPVIYFNPNLSEEMKLDTKIHELTNHFMAPVSEKLYPMMSKIVEENIIPFDKKWPKEKQEFYDYVIDPNEQNIQSYLNVARKRFDLKPDEVITEEKLNEMRKKAEEAGMFNRESENFNPDIYLLFHMAKDNAGLMKWFNLLAQNEDSKDMQYAKQGGSMGYGLGDEVDEPTMRKLKRLGYTFEKTR